MTRFEGKAVIITGGGSGLGRAAAERLASEGADLLLVDIDDQGLKQTKHDLESAGAAGRILTEVADVADEAQVRGYVETAVAEFGSIDGFFNNAGIEGTQNLTEDFGSDEFDKVVSINLNGVFHGMAAVLEVMHAQGYGAIVNTASVGGIRGVGNQSGYAASKHGVVGLTRNSAIEYGQFGISINAIAPGAIMTPMVENSLKQIDEDNWEQVGEEFVSANPMQRFGEPREVAALVAFLLSGEAPFVNGAVITIDGGQSYKY
ncbi:MAG: glucose 1-dehydrogenase [Nitriliruptorales bacterium]|nr:glucose 1-dehydrogenase [Nitriliruptorales bacterium]